MLYLTDHHTYVHDRQYTYITYSTRPLSVRALEINKYAELNYEKEGEEIISNFEPLESPISESSMTSGDSRRPSKMGRRTSVDLEEKLDLSQIPSRSSMHYSRDAFFPSVEEKGTPASEEETNASVQARIPSAHPSSEMMHISSESIKSSGAESSQDTVSLKGHLSVPKTPSLDTTDPGLSIGTSVHPGPVTVPTLPRPPSIPGSTPPSISPGPILPQGLGQVAGHQVIPPLVPDISREMSDSMADSVNKLLPAIPQVSGKSADSINASSISQATGADGTTDAEKTSRSELTFQPHQLAELESNLASPLTMSKPTTARAYPSDSEPSVQGLAGVITTDAHQNVLGPVTTGDWSLDPSAVALALGNIKTKSTGGKDAAVGVVSTSEGVKHGEGEGEKSNRAVVAHPVDAITGAAAPSVLGMLPAIVKTKKTWTNGKRDDDDDHSSVASTDYGSDVFADISMSRQVALNEFEDESEGIEDGAVIALNPLFAEGMDATHSVQDVHTDVSKAIQHGVITQGSTLTLPSTAHMTPGLPLGIPQAAHTAVLSHDESAIKTKNLTLPALPNRLNTPVLDPLETLSENGSFSSGIKSLSAASTLPSEMAQTPRGPVSLPCVPALISTRSSFLCSAYSTATMCAIYRIVPDAGLPSIYYPFTLYLRVRSGVRFGSAGCE